MPSRYTKTELSQRFLFIYLLNYISGDKRQANSQLLKERNKDKHEYVHLTVEG